MLPHWKHLLLGQRKSIANMLAQGWRLKKIASVLGMDPTSISKEIKRNRTKVVGGPDCPKNDRFPFVCDNCPLRYQKSKCRCARWRYVASDAQAKADRRLTQSRAGFFDDLESAIGAAAFAKVFPFVLTDNDPCFSGFEAIEFSAETGEKRTSVYFCDPYVSNQKASVENINGQLRRYFPKKRNVDEYTDGYVAQSFDNINSALLKSLGGETPKAAMRAVFGDDGRPSD